MKKKILAIFLSCAMLISLVSVPVFAEDVHVHTECLHENYTDTPLNGQTVPATCKETAIVHRICGDCGTDLGYKQVSGDHSFKTDVKEATCDSPAMAGEVCEVCGATNGDMTVVEGSEALGHDMKLDTTNEKYEAATCEKGGLDTLKCSRCDHTEEKATEPLGHDWVDGDVVEAGCVNAAGVEQTCGNCGETRVQEFEGELASPATDHDWNEGVVTEPTCKDGGYTTYTCKKCGETKVENETEAVPDNHVAKLVNTLKEATCTTNGIGKYECEHCGTDLGYKVIEAAHDWDDTPYVSDDSTAVYNVCKKCDAAKIIVYFGEQDIEAGYVIPSLKIDANMTVSGAVETNVALTVQVAADLSLYNSFWLEINGVKVAEYTESNGVYTFVYNTSVNNMADTFVVVLKADVAGVICSGEAVTYNFELLEGAFSADSVATDKIANATASFAGRGVLIGETVRLLYYIKASETDVLVLKKYGTVRSLIRSRSFRHLPYEWKAHSRAP